MENRLDGQTTGQPRPLWAPWRIEYIRAEAIDGCFFCVKGRGDKREDHVLARGKTGFALLNTFPYNSGHILVAPYRHVADLDDLEQDEVVELMTLIVEAKRALTRALAPQGFNIGFNIGEPAGAGVADHVHGHVVPRWIGDTNFMPVLGNARVVPESLNATAAMLREAW